MSSDSTTPTTKVILGCAKCGASLPDEAQFCLKCGAPITVPAKPIPVVELPSPEPRPRKPKRHFVLWTALAVLLAFLLWAAVSENPYAQGVQEFVGWKHDQTVLANPFSVAAHTFRYYKFTLPEGSTNVALIGQFTVSAVGGKTNKADQNADNSIELYVLSEPAFAVWQNGYTTSSVYESGRIAQTSVQADLPAGAGVYYLVFSNKFAPKAAKNVNASFFLRYKSWLPQWFRSLKNDLWNWLGL